MQGDTRPNRRILSRGLLPVRRSGDPLQDDTAGVRGRTILCKATQLWCGATL